MVPQVQLDSSSARPLLQQLVLLVLLVVVHVVREPAALWDRLEEDLLVGLSVELEVLQQPGKP